MSTYTKLLLTGLCLAAVLMACGVDNKIMGRPDNPWSDAPEVPGYQTELTVVGAYDTPGPAMGVFIQGNFCYVADAQAGLLVLDVSNPESPILRGQYSISGLNRVSVFNNNAYLAETNQGLPIIDVSDPDNPTLTNVFSATLARDGYVANNVLYLPRAGGVGAVDVADPVYAREIGQVSMAEAPWDLAIWGNHAFVAHGMSGITSINISDPEQLSVTGHLSLPGFATELCLDEEGSIAYVAVGNSGVQVVNIVDAAQPFLAGSYDLTSSVYGVAYERNHLFLAADNLGVVVLNVAKPAQPLLINSFQDNSRTRGICVQDDYVYAADVNKGLVILKFKH